MIYVFRTNVQAESQVLKLKPHLDKILPKGKWNFDLEDCDKILRIDNMENIVSIIIDLLKTYKFICEELE